MRPSRSCLGRQAGRADGRRQVWAGIALVSISACARGERRRGRAPLPRVPEAAGSAVAPTLEVMR